MIEMKVLKNRKEWLGKRSKYIGGSDCACILGLNPYKSNVDLYLEKIGEKQSQDISDKPQVKFGIAAEPIIRELFQINYPQMQMIASLRRKRRKKRRKKITASTSMMTR